MISVQNMRGTMPRIVKLAVTLGSTAVFLALSQGVALGWNFNEHQAIGRAAYLLSCQELEETAESRKRRLRYDVACGDRYARAAVYGQATAVGGDHLRDPEDFFSRKAGRYAQSLVHYGFLAQIASDHFHPHTRRKWREYHAKAIDLALEAARLEGAEQQRVFERAFYYNALADHFLHDSFPSGHMGFNREASSNAAAMLLHDRWNEDKRWVKNELGQRWETVGDARLRERCVGNSDCWRRCIDPRTSVELASCAICERAKECWKHLIRPATSSVHAVLRTFVTGKRWPRLEQRTWRMLPSRTQLKWIRWYSHREPSLPGDYPIEMITKPAETVLSLTGQYNMWGRFRDGPQLHGGSASIHHLIKSFKFFSLYTELGLGGAHSTSRTWDIFVAAPAVQISFQPFLDGLVRHSLGLQLPVACHREWALMPSLYYQANLELGTFLIYLRPGFGFMWEHPSNAANSIRASYQLTAGVGWFFFAEGGGLMSETHEDRH
jgi:hypothetical protein